MSRLLTQGSSVAALAALPSVANATTTTANAAAAAAAADDDDDVYSTDAYASDVYANATAADAYANAAGCAELTEGVREVSAAEEAMLRLAMPMALLLFFLLLRGLIGHLVPATPRWLALLNPNPNPNPNPEPEPEPEPEPNPNPSPHRACRAAQSAVSASSSARV